MKHLQVVRKIGRQIEELHAGAYIVRGDRLGIPVFHKQHAVSQDLIISYFSGTVCNMKEYMAREEGEGGFEE